MSEENINNQSVQSTASTSVPASQPQSQPVPQQTNPEPVILPQPNNTETFTKGAKPKK